MTEYLPHQFQVSRLPKNGSGRIVPERVRANLSRNARPYREAVKNVHTVATSQAAASPVREQIVLRVSVLPLREPRPNPNQPAFSFIGCAAPGALRITS